ncbi:zinc finger domain-containing protein [Streptomyces niveus]
MPLEAIELDAFRSLYEKDSFWCGLLLGGCGGQLTTKLYTDRVCHFAHHPGPDGQPHLCGRRARSVSSADHLYVKAAAAAWLRNRGTQADFDFAQPDGTPLGSVVDIQLTHKRLRVHLDQGVAPEWDSPDEPVLGMSVPVDQDTLIKRWYVHRIRLDSEGTSRRVRIGTEAFARQTEWFPLEECAVTDRGLSTPAVERIIQAHSTPEPARWTPGKKQKTSPQDERAQELMRRLLYARRTESPGLTATVCREIAGLSRVSPQLQERLDTAHHSASLWAEKEVESRRTQVSLLDQAVAAQKISQVKSLIAQTKKATKVDQTEEEERAIRAALAYLAVAIPAAIDRLNALLEEVSHIRANGDPELLTRKVRQMSGEADELRRVGKGVPHQRAQLALWEERLRSLLVPPPGSPTSVPSHQLVGRGYWTAKMCPLCAADCGRQCVILDGPRTGQLRGTPHADRLRLLTGDFEKCQTEGKEAQTVWQSYDVTCPVCHQKPGAWCRTPGRPHALRSKLAADFTQQKRQKPEKGIAPPPQ